MNIKKLLDDRLSQVPEELVEDVIDKLESEDSDVVVPVYTDDDLRLSDGHLVDNIDAFASKFLDFTNPDAVYFVVAMRRFKDGNTDVRNRYVEYPEKWFINSQAKWDASVQSFYDVSHKYNARIYAYPNARSAAQISFHGARLKAQGVRNPYSRAAGRSFDLPERPITHMDIDSTDPVILARVREVLDEEGLQPIFEYVSPSGGFHFIFGDKRVFQVDWSTKGVGTIRDIRTGRYDPYSVVAPELDKPLLLYYDGGQSTADYIQYSQKRAKRGIDVK